MRYRVVAVLIATLTVLLTSCGAGDPNLPDVPDQGGTETRTVDDDIATQDPGEP